MTKSNIVKRIETARDIVLLRLDGRRNLVVSCDSTGAIGPKPLDSLKVDAAIVGKFTARVTLMEIIAVGAKPICLTVTLCVEPVPTGREIMKGVRRELNSSGFGGVSIVQSSEKNFRVRQTSVGVTANGIVDDHHLRVGRCKRGDFVIAVGKPLVGREVIAGERTGSIADLNVAQDLLELPYVHEIIPVGSTGIMKEASILGADSRLHFYPELKTPVDTTKSAGPATVILCAIVPTKWSQLQKTIDKPLSFIGELR